MFEKLKRTIEEIEKRIEFDPTNEAKYKMLVKSYPELDFVTERELFKQYIETHDKEIRNIIFRCHLNDVYTVCKKESEYKFDTISEGNLSLLQYIDEYALSLRAMKELNSEIPYISFRKNLKTRLTMLYRGMFDNNDAFLKTRMSTYDLACLEETGKNLTEESEESNEYDELTSRDQEKLVIVHNDKYLMSRKEGKEIFKKVFPDSKKVKSKVLNKKYRCEEIDY